jgi:hypothetical protein
MQDHSATRCRLPPPWCPQRGVASRSGLPSWIAAADSESDAIYQYLSAIPFIGGPPAPGPLHNDCH